MESGTTPNRPKGSKCTTLLEPQAWDPNLPELTLLKDFYVHNSCSDHKCCFSSTFLPINVATTIFHDPNDFYGLKLCDEYKDGVAVLVSGIDIAAMI